MRKIQLLALRLPVLLLLISLLSCVAPFIKPSERLTGHVARVMDITWSPDNREVASCGFDGTVRVWDTQKQTSTAVFNTDSPWVLSVVWSPDGKRLAVTTNTSVEVWDPVSDKRVVQLATGPAVAHGPRNIYAAWSPDGRRLALYGWPDGSIKIISSEDGTEVALLTKGTAMVSSVEWSRDGKRIASAGWDRKLRFWDTATWAETSEVDLDIYGVIKIAWSPDGKRLSWHGYLNDELVLWDTVANKLERKLTVPSGITAAAWSPDGHMIATASGNGTVDLWDAETGALKRSLLHENPIDRMAWSRDSKHIATVPFGENVVKVWDVATGDVNPLVGEAGSVTALAWSRDGKRLATGNYDGSVLVWDKF
ncbi:MAG TPA: WD40 repeat domain-containing protein [Thermodesulfobacteriota bacterium]|nr:WD40 repeat domain-containing protein [Thermodesulfobacteriota bacterium]